LMVMAFRKSHPLVREPGKCLGGWRISAHWSL
jgi:hypothetical protein